VKSVSALRCYIPALPSAFLLRGAEFVSRVTDDSRETPAAERDLRSPFFAKNQCSRAGRHVMQPNLVSLGFMFSAERHEYAELRASTERSHDCTLFVVIHVGHRDCDARERSLREVLFQNALCTVT